MTISKGDRIPDVTLVKATPDGPEKVQSGDYFKGKKVALFSVPGRCLAEQVGVNAPGTENSATFLPLKYSPDWTFSGPSGVALTSVTSGLRSPLEIVIAKSPPVPVRGQR